MARPFQLLAFVHVEKAAGTSFIHILRHNFFMRYLDVRPFDKASRRVFRPSDLRLSLRVLPGLSCIAGHSVKPFAGLEEVVPDIRYLTILRNPAKRYVSQYQYWVERMGKKLTFEEFLRTPSVENFQTKKFSETGDIDEALEVLSERLFLVGLVEEFDRFLVLLRKKLLPLNFDPRYRRKNLSVDKEIPGHFLERFQDDIEERNVLDNRLYDFALRELFPRYVDEYGDRFELDVSEFRRTNSLASPPMGKRYADYAFRKLYLQPVTGVIRRSHGMPARGSY
ncbi:MAG TPA: hypothetical protein VLK65_23510 [Vicinamibacteria bacterium]|nr:hypothetical protein [Vicinamibacteria bacterium]